MKKRGLLLLVVVLFAGIFMIIFWVNNRGALSAPENPLLQVSKGQDQEYQSLENQISCMFYDEKAFLSHVSNSKTYQVPYQTIRGGVVPHHLTAGVMMASLLHTVAAQKPKTIVVVAPNHSGAGNHDVLTAKGSFKTPSGPLLCDNTLVDSLVEQNVVGIDNLLMEKDHSINGLIPYIAYYFPDAKILPLLLKSGMDQQRAKMLGQNLHSQVKDQQYFFLASVDFSHYLTMKKADENDMITQKSILEWDFQTLDRLDNGYLDSPPSIMTLMGAMEKEGCKAPTMLDHNNLARICGDPTISQTTSYFTFLYGK